MTSRTGAAAGRRGSAAWLAALALALSGAPAHALGDPGANMTIRFGISRETFRDVNDNDAAVAMDTYTKTVGDLYGVHTLLTIFDGPAEMRDKLKRREIDLVNVPGPQLLDLDKEEIEGPVLVSSSNADPFERYVLLVRADGPIKTVADLRGRSLVKSDDLRSALAQIWLEVLLDQHGLGARDGLGKLDLAAKPAQAILPVFFGKYDACVAPRNAWDVMGELNPQVKTRLRALAESPPLVTGVAVFRRGVSAEAKNRILDVLGSSQKTPGFQQVLTLFRLSQVNQLPESSLDTTRELLRAHRLTVARRGEGAAPRASPALAAKPGR